MSLAYRTSVKTEEEIVSHRTGIAAALLLAALGADYETILADYELSNLFYRREASQLEKLFHAMGYPQEYLDMTVAVFAGVHFSFLEQAWQYIETEWGTPVGFIQNALGISSTDIELLKGRYLENEIKTNRFDVNDR